MRNKGFLFIPLDQNFGSGGIFVDFFGQKAATATGPVVLAQRTGVAIVPCFILRGADNRHKIIFEPALVVEKSETEEQTIALNIQKITTIIERYIHRHLEEWGWIHRRWKTKQAAV